MLNPCGGLADKHRGVAHGAAGLTSLGERARVRLMATKSSISNAAGLNGPCVVVAKATKAKKAKGAKRPS